MEKRFTIAVWSLLFLAGSAAAQTVYDAAKFIDKDLNGTARFVSMGGAMSALGGDISTMNTNPAGIGIYRSNDLQTTFGLSAFNSKNKTLDGTYKMDDVKGDFDQIGFVYSSKIGNATALRYVNFGFNYRRSKSFFRKQKFSGGLGDFTQTLQMAQQADGIKYDAWDNAFNNDEIGWLSAIGYYGGVIDPVGENEEYIGMYDQGLGSLDVEEHGHLDEYSFNISFNVNDRVYLGLTMGAYDLNYRKYTTYIEDYPGTQLEGYDLSTWNRIVGTGVDFKLGAIFRPFEDSPFRFGLAVHTPTFFSLDYKTSARLTSTVLDQSDGNLYDYDVYTADQLPSRGEMVRPFHFQTPWAFNVSLASTIGNQFAVDAEYEYKDYSFMKFKDVDGYDAVFDFENSTRKMTKAVHGIKVGMEFKPIPEFGIRAGYNYRTAIFEDNAYKDLPYYSIQTDTDYANTQDRHTFAFGIGYRGSMFYADLAYKLDTYNSNMYPFVVKDGHTIYPSARSVTKVTNTRNQAMLTLGVRF
ncbi:MAG: TonB-dependent receptor [Bacteroidaceae bacterium]|nr:TonB-dependent receptor [Bacteroidaceae bacterium]